MKSNSFIHYLTQRNKLTFRNIRNGEEFWHIFVNRLHIIGAVVAILVLTFVGVLLVVAYTPIIDLVPGNPGYKARQLLIENIQRLDSLEKEVNGWEIYNANMLLILEGGTPNTLFSDSVTRIDKNSSSIVAKTMADSLLRLRHSRDSAYMKTGKTRKNTELTFEMIPPSSGMIVKRFDPKNNSYGITITPPPGNVILGVMDGTVVMSEWDPKNGQVIVVQHAANMTSIYKQTAQSLKAIGERIRAGEPIAVSGNIKNGQIPKLEFEIWQNGAPVDPENYIAF